MDPVVAVFEANFKACREYVSDKVANINVLLMKDDRVLEKRSLTHASFFKLNIKNNGDFDMIRVKCETGLQLSGEGMPLEGVLAHVSWHQEYDTVDVYQYTKDGGCELDSFEFDEDIIVFLYDDVERVMITTGNGYDMAMKNISEEKKEGVAEKCHSEGYDTCGR